MNNGVTHGDNKQNAVPKPGVTKMKPTANPL